MANRLKISQMTPKGANLEPTDLLEISENTGSGYVTKSITGQEIIDAIGYEPTGLFTETSSSIPVENTTSEESLIGTGVGLLYVPGGTFQVGDSYHVILTGHLDAVNNDTLIIRVKSDSGVILATTGAITMANTTNKHWKFEAYFTIRQIGAAGVASIVTGGTFMYTKNASNAFEGINFSTEENTLFDTNYDNTLEITAQWSSASINNSIYSEICTLTKTY